MDELKKIIAVTPTCHHAGRIKYFRRCIKTFKKISNFLWIIIEDADALDPKVEKLLSASKIDYKYYYYGPTMDWGTSQRNYAFSLIRKEKLRGIVYVPDDDNFYEPRLFDEIRKTKKISVFPVGHLGPHLIEGPIIENNRIVGWDSWWKTRKFPLDWAGFALNSQLLIEHNGEFLKGFNWVQAVKDGTVDPNMANSEKHRFLRAHKDGESLLLEHLNISIDDFEFLCDRCSKCYVWHNQPLWENPWFTHYRRKFFKLIRDFIARHKMLRDTIKILIAGRKSG